MDKLLSCGHHLNEYQAMFALPLKQWKTAKLLEYGSCLGAVNAQASQQGVSFISCDPLFMLDTSRLFSQVSSLFETMEKHMVLEKAQFDFHAYGGFETFIAQRRQGIEMFLADYEKGNARQRYLPIQDTLLPFEDFAFDFVLSGYHLFTKAGSTNTVEYHLRLIRALTRVAKEVRFFPLVDSQGHVSSLLGPVLLALQQARYGIEIREVDYSLHSNGNAMLRVWAQHCELK